MNRSLATWLVLVALALLTPLALGPDANATPTPPWAVFSDDDDSGGTTSPGDDDDDSGGGTTPGDDDDSGGGTHPGDDDDSGGGTTPGDDDDNGGPMSPVKPYCFADQNDCPCGNNDPNGGCTNGSGTGAFITGSGSRSVAADDLVLTVSGLPPGTFGQFLMAKDVTRMPMMNSGGLLCIAPPFGEKIFRMMPGQVSPQGTFTEGPGIVAFAAAFNMPPIGQIDPGETWYFQFWFRDMTGPCMDLSGTSNAVEVLFAP